MNQPYEWITGTAKTAAAAVPRAAGLVAWAVTAFFDGVFGGGPGLILLPLATRHRPADRRSRGCSARKAEPAAPDMTNRADAPGAHRVSRRRSLPPPPPATLAPGATAGLSSSKPPYRRPIMPIPPPHPRCPALLGARFSQCRGPRSARPVRDLPHRAAAGCGGTAWSRPTTSRGSWRSARHRVPVIGWGHRHLARGARAGDAGAGWSST